MDEVFVLTVYFTVSYKVLWLRKLTLANTLTQIHLFQENTHRETCVATSQTQGPKSFIFVSPREPYGLLANMFRD